MILSFGDKATEDFYKGVNSPQARKLLPRSLKAVAIRKLNLVNSVAIVGELRIPPGNRLEKLKGDLDGMHSIRINQQSRIIFFWTEEGPKQVQNYRLSLAKERTMLPTKRRPTHPGEILWEEFLKPMGISQSAFAKHLGGSWTQPKLSAIINGRRSVTETIALDFADALGTTPQLWLNLQATYNLWNAMKKHEKIPKIRKKDIPGMRRRVA